MESNSLSIPVNALITLHIYLPWSEYSSLKIWSTFLGMCVGGKSMHFMKTKKAPTYTTWEKGILFTPQLSFAESAVNSQWVQGQCLPDLVCPVPEAKVPLVLHPSPSSISSHCRQPPLTLGHLYLEVYPPDSAFISNSLSLLHPQLKCVILR
jgi:hypothetical protein